MDTRKYQEVWDMNEVEIIALVRQLLQADKVVHEQQLGLAWAPPEDEVFISPHGLAGMLGAGPSGAGTAEGGANGEDPDNGEENAEVVAAKQLAEKVHDPRNTGALQLLVDEGGFLLEAKTRSMIEQLSKDEQGLVKVRSSGTAQPGIHQPID